MAETLEGHCLCGAVTITVRSHANAASVCHCDMCRHWSGAATWCLEAPEDAVAYAGPVNTYRSSEFAERAWCGACGTHLWIKTAGEGYDLMPGLFDGARDMALDREIYADRAFASVALAGDHTRVTRAAYEAANPHVEGNR